MFVLLLLGLGRILFCRIPDIQLIFNAGYPVPAGYLANVRYPAIYRISGVKNQPDIMKPDSFNIRYPAGY